MRFKYKIDTEKQEVEIPFSQVFWWYIALCMMSVLLIYGTFFILGMIYYAFGVV